MKHIVRMPCTGRQTSVSLMISPLVRQSFLLSSNTVFMFSIQMASTGPSNKYHFLSGVSLLEPSLTKEERMPSVLQGKEVDVKMRNRSVVAMATQFTHDLTASWMQFGTLK